jgi:quinol monooxygenase YgiN
MVDVIIKMTVSEDKRNEVLGTIKSLLDQIRHEQGCVSCHCYRDVEAEDVVIFTQEWKTNEAFTTHLRSGYFKILQGAMKLLSMESEIRVNTIIATDDVEALAALRG